VSTSGITRQLAEYVATARFDELPEPVKREAIRAFLNIIGCTLGGSRQEAIAVMKKAFTSHFGAPTATLIGLKAKADVLHASYINCLSSSVDSFDDNHAEMILHPAGPVACALLALCEQRPVSGAQLLHAFALGMEVMCRLCRSISVPPARANLAWVQTGIVGGMGAAAGAAKLLGLDTQKVLWAIGIAGSKAAGYRGNHGTMCTPLMPAQTARSGVEAAFLAEEGFTSAETSIEGKYGFCNVFAETPNAAAIVAGLGTTFDLLGITYKPYPAGVVLNPIIEAGLTLKRKNAFDSNAVNEILVIAHPTAIAITDRKHPADPMAAQLSLQHWVSAALASGKATTAELSMERISDPAIVALRDKVKMQSDPELSPDGAKVVVRLGDGRELSSVIEACIGSGQRPMSDGELEDKFRGQTAGLKSDRETDALIKLCWRIGELDDPRVIVHAAA
jgi:2-methylcitrate dehydratase PrpD